MYHGERTSTRSKVQIQKAKDIHKNSHYSQEPSELEKRGVENSQLNMCRTMHTSPKVPVFFILQTT